MNKCLVGWVSIILTTVKFIFLAGLGFFKTQMIIVISMNFYIWSYSIDESDKEEYMEFSRNCCIGYMPAYTYGDDGYF